MGVASVRSEGKTLKEIRELVRYDPELCQRFLEYVPSGATKVCLVLSETPCYLSWRLDDGSTKHQNVKYYEDKKENIMSKENISMVLYGEDLDYEQDGYWVYISTIRDRANKKMPKFFVVYE
jgi:hypothetical protein